MIGYLRSFFNRNKKKIIVTTTIASLVYIGTRYIQDKINEFQERVEEENFAKEQIKRRFQQTQKDCYLTFLSLIPVLNEPIFQDLPVEKITNELQLKRLERQLGNGGDNNVGGSSTINSDDLSSSQSGSGIKSVNNSNSNSNSKSKTQLWSDLKIVSIARFLSAIYAQSMLLVLIHIQLNILSRKAYLATAIDLASKTQGIPIRSSLEDEEELNFKDLEAEKKFLSLTYYLISDGYKKIVKECQIKVELIFKDINVRQELTIIDFFELIKKTAVSIKVDPNEVLGFAIDGNSEKLSPLSSLDINNNALNFNGNDKFEILKNELINYFNSSETLITIDHLFIGNIERIKNSLLSDNDATTNKKKLAALLVQLTKMTPNDDTQQLQAIDELNDLSASVYSNF
ncbi:hypothetical protein PACTADRAFT_48393 [Pachysolen tannophilus NRRL Y-2460]|uniref:Peroxin-3 n=1 Tax=Pachysolen tannophilus NRRL Y-2460 TaxID=669874 RepID=A0A1E4TXV5_PACTA|nr:hypothetical protein PACTADRAFT_48393 [Pachysolen tannophilus NRRL Y-2460]